MKYKVADNSQSEQLKLLCEKTTAAQVAKVIRKCKIAALICYKTATVGLCLNLIE